MGVVVSEGAIIPQVGMYLVSKLFLVFWFTVFPDRLSGRFPVLTGLALSHGCMIWVQLHTSNHAFSEHFVYASCADMSQLNMEFIHGEFLVNSCGSCRWDWVLILGAI